MKTNNTDLLQKWALDFFLGRTSRKIAFNQKSKSVKNEDTVQISWRAKRVMRNAEIEKMLNSGEPLKDVTFEEFCDYYYDTHGCTLSNSLPQQYRQALKGDNASLREREWRTNPEYIIPQRLFSSPEVTADREAALEKYRNGGELKVWESKLLRTFPNVDEGIRLESEAKLERTTRNFQNLISSALSEIGIELSEDDELQFDVWGYGIIVSGNIDEEKLKALNEKLSDNAIDFQNYYHHFHRDEAIKGGFPLIYLWSAEKFLKEAGGGSVFDIGKDRSGNFTGLPESLSEFIKKNAVGEFGRGVSKENKYREKDIEKALYMRETFNSVIETVQNGDYNRLKAMTCKLTYKNGILSC
ncbi:MAG: hypothetical protein K2J11_01685 [Oscillospiraceae bacterium]|nr:hypothetical protein [Oscillospiraceae bacterium]